MSAVKDTNPCTPLEWHDRPQQGRRRGGAVLAKPVSTLRRASTLLHRKLSSRRTASGPEEAPAKRPEERREHFPFLRLPYRIRERIYADVLRSEKLPELPASFPTNVKSITHAFFRDRPARSTDRSKLSISILTVNKLIHAEASKVLYEDMTWLLHDASFESYFGFPNLKLIPAKILSRVRSVAFIHQFLVNSNWKVNVQTGLHMSPQDLAKHADRWFDPLVSYHRSVLAEMKTLKAVHVSFDIVFGDERTLFYAETQAQARIMQLARPFMPRAACDKLLVNLTATQKPHLLSRCPLIDHARDLFELEVRDERRRTLGTGDVSLYALAPKSSPRRAPFRLLGLPREVRDNIYYWALLPYNAASNEWVDSRQLPRRTVTNNVGDRPTRRSSLLGLLVVNKQLHREASQILWHSVVFFPGHVEMMVFVDRFNSLARHVRHVSIRLATDRLERDYDSFFNHHTYAFSRFLSRWSGLVCRLSSLQTLRLELCIETAGWSLFYAGREGTDEDKYWPDKIMKLLSLVPKDVEVEIATHDPPEWYRGYFGVNHVLRLSDEVADIVRRWLQVPKSKEIDSWYDRSGLQFRWSDKPSN